MCIRDSFNSADAGRYLITCVEFALTPGAAPRLDYADLQRHFASNPTPSLAEVRQAVLTIRGRKGMVIDRNDPDSRSAGSFFRNPVVSVAHYQSIVAASSEPVPHYEMCIRDRRRAAAQLCLRHQLRQQPRHRH